MSGADLTNPLFIFICLMTVLLALFIYEVIRTPLEISRATEQPVLNLPEPPPPGPAAPAAPPALPVRQAPVFPAGSGAQPAMAGQAGNGAYSARHASAYAPVVSRPKVTGGPPWGPAPKPPDLEDRAFLSAGHPVGLPSLSAGHPARLASGRLTGTARWHDFVHGDPGP